MQMCHKSKPTVFGKWFLQKSFSISKFHICLGLTSKVTLVSTHNRNQSYLQKMCWKYMSCTSNYCLETWNFQARHVQNNEAYYQGKIIGYRKKIQTSRFLYVSEKIKKRTKRKLLPAVWKREKRDHDEKNASFMFPYRISIIVRVLVSLAFKFFLKRKNEAKIWK